MRISYKDKLALPLGISFNVVWQADAKVNQTEVDEYVDTLVRPGWYQHESSNMLDTRLYMIEIYQPFSTREVNHISGRKVLERCWYCEKCKEFISYSGVQIGHITKWRTELKQAGVLSPNEAKAAYNNLTNLRIECSTCNMSHDWE